MITEDGGAKREIDVVSHELYAAMEIVAGQLEEMITASANKGPRS